MTTSRGERAFGRAEGVRFGLTLGFAFVALSALLFWRGHEAAWRAMAAVGIGLAALGLTLPARLGPLFRAWMALARAISRVTTPLVMGLLYYGLITPAGLVRRAFGSDPIRRRAEDGSYWVHRSDGGARTDLYRQF